MDHPMFRSRSSSVGPESDICMPYLTTVGQRACLWVQSSRGRSLLVSLKTWKSCLYGSSLAYAFEPLEENLFYFFLYSCIRVDERGILFLVRVFKVLALSRIFNLQVAHRSIIESRWVWLTYFQTWLDLFLLRCTNLRHISIKSSFVGMNLNFGSFYKVKWLN